MGLPRLIAGWLIRENPIYKWWFPEIGVPPNHPFSRIGFSILNYLFLGTPILGNPQMDDNYRFFFILTQEIQLSGTGGCEQTFAKNCQTIVR